MTKSKYDKYFTISNGVSKCKCLKCDYTYKSTSISNPTNSLRAHLKNAHNDLYKKLEEDERAIVIEKEKLAEENAEENNNNMTIYDAFKTIKSEPAKKISSCLYLHNRESTRQ
jgi:IMP dehydrogenase/GMP reductase